ncbi:hypothetical protein LCGC14_2775940, partial [marine sediment metagenome]
VKHSKKQIELLAKSIEEFGWTVPIIIDQKNEVIAGHARLQAAEHLGMKTVPVIVISDLTRAQVRAYRIADNRLAQLAPWLDDLLELEFKALDAAGFNLDLTGFGIDDQTRFLGKLEFVDDAVADPPKRPKTKLGDLYHLGDHRLLCGDATNEKDVGHLLNGSRPHLMVTDPPYGVQYDASWRSEAAKRGGKAKGTFGSAARAEGKVKNDDSAAWGAAWALFPGDVAYVWHGGNNAHIVAQSIEQSGFDIRSQIIWAKNNIVIGRGHYHWQHEPCWYAVREGKKGHWSGSRKQSTVWDIDKPMKSETGHSTQKPVECMARPMLNNSKKGDLVYDPFMGSGTSIVAAETTDRICYGMEIDPGYCDVAVSRWEKLTGRKARKHGSKAKKRKAKKRA